MTERFYVHPSNDPYLPYLVYDRVDDVCVGLFGTTLEAETARDDQERWATEYRQENDLSYYNAPPHAQEEHS